MMLRTVTKEKSATRRARTVLNAGAIGVAAVAFVALVGSGLSLRTSMPERITMVPEYERRLETVVLSASEDDPTLSAHAALISNLPNYSKVLLLLPKTMEDVVSRREGIQMIPYDPIAGNPESYFLVFPEHDRLIEVDAAGQRTAPGTLWAQDLFEVGLNKAGTPVLLIPDVYKWFSSYDDTVGRRSVISDTAFLEKLSTPCFDVVRTSVTFQGGNVLYDRVDGQIWVFCGVNVLNRTRTVWRSSVEKPFDDQDITSAMEEAFGADRLFIVGEDLQPPSLLFHLDQAVVLLADRTAATLRIVESISGSAARDTEYKELIEVRRFLDGLRELLRGLGYRIVDIHVREDSLARHRQDVNGVPFIHRETGRPTYLMPVYPEYADAEERAISERNMRVFTDIGYDVVPTLVRTDRINGGLHCIMNVLE